MAGLWAMVSPLVWIRPGLVANPMFWHLHELFFGMAAAAVGGYLLTALPHWAGRGIRPGALGLLVLFWTAGRGAQAWPGLPVPVLLAAALSYPVLLGAALSVPLLRARAWPRLWMGILPLILAGADAALLLADRQGAGDAWPLRLTLGFSLMIGLIGGRAVPAFARSRLKILCPEAHLHDRPALGILAALMTFLATGFLSFGLPFPAGVALLVAGAAQALRLSGWRPFVLRSQTDILMMLLAFGWLALGQALLGLGVIRPDLLRPEEALHVLTMGAMGSMILAIAARPLLPRQAGRLRTTPDIGLAFTLLSAGTMLRLTRPETVAGLDALPLAACLWSAGWGLYLIRALRCWRHPAPFPALSVASEARTAPPPSIPAGS